MRRWGSERGGMSERERDVREKREIEGCILGERKRN